MNSLCQHVNLVVAADQNFVTPMVVAIFSAQLNIGQPRLDITVLDCGIKDKTKGEIVTFLSGLPKVAGIKFSYVDRALFRRFSTLAHVSKAAYARIAMARAKEMVGNSRVIYMDCDAIVEGDVADLFAEDLCGKTVGAVQDTKAP